MVQQFRRYKYYRPHLSFSHPSIVIVTRSLGFVLVAKKELVGIL